MVCILGTLNPSFTAALGEKSLCLGSMCHYCWSVFKGLLILDGIVGYLDQVHTGKHSFTLTHYKHQLNFRGWLLTRWLYVLKTGLLHKAFINPLPVWSLERKIPRTTKRRKWTKKTKKNPTTPCYLPILVARLKYYCTWELGIYILHPSIYYILFI